MSSPSHASDFHPIYDEDHDLSVATPDDPVRLIERRNILSLSKLSIKSLIDASLRIGRHLENPDFPPLLELFVALELLLRHGLKGKRMILGRRKEPWDIIEAYCKIACDEELNQSIRSCRSLPSVRSNVGRWRAWLRIALMQKKLSTYFLKIINCRDNFLSEFYESYATLMHEESSVIAGLLIGLNVIDINIPMKGINLDTQPLVINLSMYFKDENAVGYEGSEDNNRENTDYDAILDQKCYLEELNGNLKSTITTLTKKLDSSNQLTTQMSNNLTIALAKGQCEKEQNEKLKNIISNLNKDFQQASMKHELDLAAERKSANERKTSLEELYAKLQKSVENEKELRNQAEEKIRDLLKTKEETSSSLKAAWQSIHEKDDTISALRQQLGDVKQLLIEWQSKYYLKQKFFNSKEANGIELEKHTKASEQLKFRLQLMEEQCSSLQSELTQQLQERNDIQATLADLQKENEILRDSQRKLNKDKSKMNELEQKCKELQKNYEERELALIEMGEHLSKAHLKASDYKEVSKAFSESVWIDDKAISDCQQCKKSFSVSRRKHHCRHCGGVFCGNCSDNNMPLPSSAKPVRVCDACYTFLLTRYNASAKRE
ncbi:RUN and FYVE domain-containing protein 2 [Trichoplax sp. H2]|nr:RUN and FYVE domain-containing protein 2 [Trichoplax sp. H2]|eukprot:RDD37184.1 RUN and FYVE domain-containing protein 2 [Trichoplax sp. H2]